MADHNHQPRATPPVAHHDSATDEPRARNDRQPRPGGNHAAGQAAKHADRYAAEDGMGRQDDPAAAMEHPSGDGNYVREGDREIPLASRRGEED